MHGKSFKRIVALILTMATVFALLCGCGSDSKDGNGSYREVGLVDGGDSRFVILRDSENSDTAKMIAKLREAMEEKLGVKVKVVNELAGDNEYEIVVGVVNGRSDSQALHEELKNYRGNNYNDYAVCRKGNKIYLAAAQNESLEKAVDCFIEKIVNSETASVPSDYEFINRPQYKYENATVGGVSVADFVIRTEKYPSYFVKKAADELSSAIEGLSGYRVSVVPMTDDLTHYEHEICIGPMNGSVKIDMVRDTHFTNKTIGTDGKLKIDSDGLIDGDGYNCYEAYIKDGSFYINGGSSYAINAGMQKVTAEFKKNGLLPDGYTLSGYYDGSDKTLSDGYGLVFAEEWDYSGSDSKIDKDVRERWSISGDTTPGPTPIGDGWDKQTRPGIYGSNWWIWNDADNGYLMEITKKSADGYEAGRLISENKWAFRYGVMEVRMVMATRNGACSAVWSATGNPGSSALRNEIDVYENFGADVAVANLHSWGAELENGHIDHSSTMDYHEAAVPAEGEHFWDTFHHLAIEWTESEVKFYMDGELFSSALITDNMKSLNNFTTIKLANGVGTQKYTQNNPDKFLEDVTKFFEVQTIDYVRIYQTSDPDSAVVYADNYPTDR